MGIKVRHDVFGDISDEEFMRMNQADLYELEKKLHKVANRKKVERLITGKDPVNFTVGRDDIKDYDKL